MHAMIRVGSLFNDDELEELSLIQLVDSNKEFDEFLRFIDHNFDELLNEYYKHAIKKSIIQVANLINNNYEFIDIYFINKYVFKFIQLIGINSKSKSLYKKDEE